MLESYKLIYEIIDKEVNFFIKVYLKLAVQSSLERIDLTTSYKLGQNPIDASILQVEIVGFE